MCWTEYDFCWGKKQLTEVELCFRKTLWMESNLWLLRLVNFDDISLGLMWKNLYWTTVNKYSPTLAAIIVYCTYNNVQCIPREWVSSANCCSSMQFFNIELNRIFFSYDNHLYPKFHVNSSLDPIPDWLNLEKKTQFAIANFFAKFNLSQPNFAVHTCWSAMNEQNWKEVHGVIFKQNMLSLSIRFSSAAFTQL